MIINKLSTMFLNDSLNAGNGLNYENLKMYPGDIKQWGRWFILCSMRHSIATTEQVKIVTPIQGLTLRNNFFKSVLQPNGLKINNQVVLTGSEPWKYIMSIEFWLGLTTKITLDFTAINDY